MMLQEVLFNEVNIEKLNQIKEKINNNIRENNIFSYPSIIKLNDIENIENNGDVQVWFRKYGKEYVMNEMMFIVEEKINGINVGVFYDEENKKVRLMTRNLIFNDIYSFYNKLHLRFPEMIVDYINERMKNEENLRKYIIFGELVDVRGNKFMKKYLKVGSIHWFIFDVYDRENNRFLSHQEKYRLINREFEWLYMNGFSNLIIPFYGVKGLKNVFKSPIVKNVLSNKFKSVYSEYKNICGEGVVVKSLNVFENGERIIFKVKQNNFGEEC